MNMMQTARWIGILMLGSILLGIASAIWIAHGIDINLTADVAATAENMLNAEIRLRAKAYMSILIFAMEGVIAIGFFYLLREHGRLLAAWALFMSLGASILVLMGAVYGMNAAEIASDEAYINLTNASQNLMLAGLQATSDYTSFHLSLVMSSISNAGFFFLLFRAKLVPTWMAGWAVFESLFVATTIVMRDFIKFLGHDLITMAFMLSNLTALILLGGYLAVKGVRQIGSLSEVSD